MLHYDVETIISQLMFSHWNFLKSDIILKHFTEMNRHTLADGLVHGVFDIKLLKSVITRIQNWQDTDDTIMIYFVISKIER